MKILICGKGGCGKSTLTALLARALQKRNYDVLLVDADESNYGLHRLLGVDLPENLMDSLGGKKSFKEELNKIFPQGGGLFNPQVSINDLPKACLTEADGIRLLVIGKIHDFGEGCACAIGMLSRTVLSHLAIGPREVVIIDTEAGIEHFGRRVDAECDLILGVVDPTYESFLLARKIKDMAVKAKADCRFVLNKVDDRVAGAMEQQIDEDTIITRLPDSEAVFMESLKGAPLTTELMEINAICDLVEAAKAAKTKAS